MRAGGFRFYKGCLSDVRRRQRRKTGWEWRLTCRIHCLRQAQENYPFLEGRSVHRPHPSNPKFLIVTAKNTATIKYAPRGLRYGSSPSHMGQTASVVCAAGPRCLRSLPVGWRVYEFRDHVVIAHECGRRVRVFQPCLISVTHTGGIETPPPPSNT